jgi:hypothetical protein
MLLAAIRTIASKPSDEMIHDKLNQQLVDGVRGDEGDFLADLASLIVDYSTRKTLIVKVIFLQASVFKV